jgi:hypothetical protein
MPETKGWRERLRDASGMISEEQAAANRERFEAEGARRAEAERSRAEAARSRHLKLIEGDLERVTKRWTTSTIIRHYESNERGDAVFADEAEVLAEHGYRPALQSAEGSHLHAGRLLLTGGWSVLAGRKGIRSKGKISVTFQRDAPSQQPQQPQPQPQ